jgi:hypothetical protein
MIEVLSPRCATSSAALTLKAGGILLRKPQSVKTVFQVFPVVRPMGFFPRTCGCE